MNSTIDLQDFWTPWELLGSYYAEDYLNDAWLRLWCGGFS